MFTGGIWAFVGDRREGQGRREKEGAEGGGERSLKDAVREAAWTPFDGAAGAATRRCRAPHEVPGERSATARTRPGERDASVGAARCDVVRPRRMSHH